MKAALYYSLVTALLMNGNPAQGAEHLRCDGMHSSKTVVVESPTAFPELAMQNAEALYLHARGDGRTFLIVEGLGGKNLSILDVSNPAHIRKISQASISATAPFDFVESLNDRALLIRYRNESGLALLNFSKRDRPLITQLASSTGAGPVQIVNDRGEPLLPQAQAMALPETRARDYQVVDTSSPLEPQVVASVPGVRQTVLKSGTGTLFLLTPSGVTVIRHPWVERDYEAALPQTAGN
jgi:hypothetical protein